MGIPTGSSKNILQVCAAIFTCGKYRQVVVGNSNRLFHHVYDRITGKYDCILIQVREIPTGGE